MAEKIFLQILNMSFTAGLVIIFVLIARLFLKKSPKVLSYALWGVVLFRLICPYSFESVFSLLPAKTNPISQDIAYEAIPTIDTGIPAINHTINQLLPAATPTASVNPLQIWVFIGSTVWLIGMAVLLIYSIVSLMKLQKLLKNAIHEKDNIYIAKHLDTPFVMGFIRPKIYLPASLTEGEKRYILFHEQMHIKRFDHVVKIVSFFVLCLHWFNPLVWIAFFISGKDMEMSCDEAVIKQLGSNVKKEYSSSLLTLATGRRIIGGSPLAFGEGDTKGRIKNVLNYKRPTFWVVVVALIAAIIIAVGLLSNPINSIHLQDADDMNFSVEMLDRVVYGTLVAGDKDKIVDFPQAKAPEIADFIKNLRISKDVVSTNRSENRDSTNQIHLAYEGLVSDGTIYNLYFNFNADFTEVWLDNETKPSLSYQVKKAEDVKIFFERQFNSITKIVEIGSAEELWKARTKYIGDNSAVGKIISLLQFPEGVTYDGVELYTKERPYAVTVKFKTDSKTRNFYSGEDNQSPFKINALIMFSLIGNAEYITFSLNDDIYDPYYMQYTSDMAKTMLGDNYYKNSETLDGFKSQIEKLLELFAFDTPKPVSAQYSIAKINKDGEILPYSSLDQQLAELIIMDYMLKSSLQEGIDIDTLDECYIIRQTFPKANETHDYYAYILDDGKAVLQSGKGGMYGVIPHRLYAQLVESFYSTNGMFFWVKPDELPQVIGDTAAMVWLKSFMEADTLAQNRISDYTITDVTVIAGEPKQGVKWEDMAYQYVVRVTYDISTATEQYFAPGDGISGKGTFQNLFRELCIKVKSDDGGGYYIVSVGTGGAEQEFA